MDNLRPQDESYGGQQVFSYERCGEEFPSRDDLKAVSLSEHSIPTELTYRSIRAHLLMGPEQSGHLISPLFLPLDLGPLLSLNLAVSTLTRTFLISECQVKTAKRPWYQSNLPTRTNLLPLRPSPCTPTRQSTRTVPKTHLPMIRPPQLLKIQPTRFSTSLHPALDRTTTL